MPPKRLVDFRDPIRIFPQQTLNTLFETHGHTCFNPYCDFKDLPLQAHHIFAHALGGRSTAQNAIMLCTACHKLVHRGAVPLEVLLDWKKKGFSKDESLISNADDLWGQIRSIPLSNTLTGHERLVELNRYLIHANHLRNLNVRHFIFGEIMLAKAAVLNDSYRDIEANINSAAQAMSIRHKRILPFGSSAKFFGNQINSPSIVVRALHYRSIAYETFGNMRSCLNTLREAWRICERIAPTGNPSQFHELSTPSRILRAIGLARAKLGGSGTQAQEEYERGLLIAETFDENLTWNETRLRQVQLCLLLNKIRESEKKLDKIWDNIDSLDPNARLIAYRLRIELLIKSKVSTVQIEPLVTEALREAATERLYRQEHHIFRLSQTLQNL